MMKHLAKQLLPLSNRGSVLIMVVVIIVVMALLGATYLQVARVQRVSVSESRTQKHIDEVAIATYEMIAGALRDDLIQDGAGDVNFELYDYPWTNYRSTRTIDTLFQSGVTVAGGQGDDQWLASTMPNFTSESDTGTWPKITNLTGFFIGASGGSATLEDVGDIPTGTNEFPVENSGNAYSTNIANRDMDIPVNSNVLVDADGDGIGDSRWTWAPYPIVDGRVYTMAVRIVDLASLLNINTSPFYPRNGREETYPLWATPGAWWPGWRFTNSKVGPSREDRALDWQQIGRYEPLDGMPQGTTSRTVLYGLADEYELRYRNGLNNADHEATIETDYATELRSASTNESTYEDVTDANGQAALFFNFNPQTGGSDTQALGMYERRKLITTLSGTNVLASPLSGGAFAVSYPSSGFGDATPGTNIQIDLNYAATTAIAARIRSVYENNPLAVLPAGFTDVTEFADAFTASIVDYGDRHSGTTSSGGALDWEPDRVVEVTPVGSWYGFEYVPMLTEVYVQCLYQIKTSNDPPVLTNPGASDPADYEWEVDWEVADNAEPGFAVEISNPYHVAIPLQGITLWFGGTQVTNNSGGADLHTLASSALATANGSTANPAFLQPGQKLVLFKDSTGGTNDDIEALVSTGNTVVVELSNQDVSMLASAGAQTNVPVELRANVFNSATPSPAFSRLTIVNCPNEFENESYQYPSNDPNYGTTTPPTLPEPRTDYYQVTKQGGNDGLGMLLITDAVGYAAELKPDDTAGVDTAFDRLGSGNKQTSASTSVAGNKQIVLQNHYTGRITHPGDLALVQILSFGGPSDQTIPERLASVSASNFDIDNFRIDLTGNTVINSGNPNYNVPHGVFLIDQFTTHHPGYDGVDNDNADGDDSDTTGNNDEIFVPGRININTMPESYLRLVLPLYDPTARADIAEEIVDYRENPRRGHAASWGNEADSTVKGIAHIGEMFEQSLAPQMTDLYHPGGVDGTDNLTIAGMEFDFLANPLDSSGNQQPDGSIDDREEMTMVPRWLSAAATTRSDVFVAFVLVQGWEVSDFSVGPRESKQYIAIFRRHVADDGTVTVRALLPGNQVYTIN